MSKSQKILIIIASSLVILGLVLIVAGICLAGPNLSALNISRLHTEEFTVDGNFSDISIENITCSLRFVKSDSESTKIICTSMEKITHYATVESGVLKIKESDNRKWFDHIGINFASPEMTVYLPENEYNTLNITGTVSNIELPSHLTFENAKITTSTGFVSVYSNIKNTLDIKVSTGKISVAGVTLNSMTLESSTGKISVDSSKISSNLKLEVSTGDITLQGVTAKNITAKSSTGDVTFSSTVAEELISISSDTGDVELTRCDASALNIETDTGDISGHLLSGKIFMAESDTGKVNVPMPSGENICKVITDTGDIKFTVE